MSLFALNPFGAPPAKRPSSKTKARARWRAQGLCTGCGHGAPAEGYAHCEYCRAAALRRRQAKKQPSAVGAE